MKRLLLLLIALCAYTAFVFWSVQATDWTGHSKWNRIHQGQKIEEVRRIMGAIYAGAGFVDDWQTDLTVFGATILSKGIEVSYLTCEEIARYGNDVCVDEPNYHGPVVYRVSTYWGLFGAFWFGQRVDLDAI